MVSGHAANEILQCFVRPQLIRAGFGEMMVDLFAQNYKACSLHISSSCWKVSDEEGILYV
jgi:hypothetical protein